MKLIVVLNNIRSVLNVGAILRTAEGFQVSKVVLSGYTPRVHDKNVLPHIREKLDKQINKTALGAEDMVDILNSDDLVFDLEKFRNEGYKIVGLENNIRERQLIPICDRDKIRGLSDKIVLILGEEVNGIDKNLYQYIDEFIEIPMKGRKESFNVSVAAGIAIYQLLFL